MTLAPNRPRLLLPGLLPRDPGLERYRVRPGGLTAVPMAAGDQLTVLDPQGRQSAELTLLADVAGLTQDAPATVLRELAAAGTADPVLGLLAGFGLDPAQARAARLFGEWSPAGATEVLTADRDTVALVAAPARPMRVSDDAANPPTELLLELRRAAPRRSTTARFASGT